MSELISKTNPAGREPDDFDSLLELSLAMTTNWPDILDEKGDFAPRQVDPLSGAELNGTLRNALRQKRDGLLRKSYASFQQMLVSERDVPQSLLASAYINLADIAAEQFELEPDAGKKILWAEQAYRWFDELTEVQKKIPQSRLFAAVRSANLRYTHHLLEDDPVIKKRLLVDAHRDLTAVNHLVTPSMEGRHYTHLYRIERELVLLAESYGQDHQDWMKECYQSASKLADLAQGKDSFAESNYRISQAYLAADLAKCIRNPEQQHQWLTAAYSAMQSNMELTKNSKNIGFLIEQQRFAARVSSDISNLTPEQTDKKDWMIRALYHNNVAAKLTLGTNRSPEAYQSFSFCAQCAGRLEQLDPSNRSKWIRAAHDFYRTITDLAERSASPGQLAHWYNRAAENAQKLADVSPTWLRKSYWERVNAAQLAFKSGELEFAAIALRLAGIVAQQIKTPDEDEREDWRYRAAILHILSAEIYLKLGNIQRFKGALKEGKAAALRLVGASPENGNIQVIDRTFCKQLYKRFQSGDDMDLI